MADVSPNFSIQLKDTCKLTGAHWAIWLKRNEKTWEYISAGFLTKTRLETIKKIILQPEHAAWLAGALSSGRTRSRQTGLFSEILGCQRLYAIPNNADRAILLVGAQRLDKAGLRFFQVLALISPVIVDESKRKTNLTEIVAVPEDFSFGSPLSPERILNHLLETIADLIPCAAAFLAIRLGDHLRIDSVLDLEPAALGSLIPIKENPVLQKMIGSKQGIIINDSSEYIQEWGLNRYLKTEVRSCLSASFLSGDRVIALAILISIEENAFSPADVHKASRYLQQVSHAMEAAILFRGVSRFLEQFSQLNEIASRVSLKEGIAEIARNVVKRLNETLTETEASLYLLFGDNEQVRIFKSQKTPSEGVWHADLDETLVGFVIHTGQAIRLGEYEKQKNQYFRDSEWPSVLAVPLIHQGKRFGAIRLDSRQANAFSPQDELLFRLVAGNLATLLENVRLNQEARGQSLNLSLIHQVVQQVVGLMDVYEIAQMSAELIAAYFDYEISVILVSDKDGEELVGAGIGGTSSYLLKPGFRYPSNQGLTGRVFNSGKSYYTNDVSQEPEYFSISDWKAGSEMCVALREGSRVFGLINVERAKKNSFTDQDLQMLESMAGILSSVMMNAHRYQELARLYSELQETIKANQNTELQLIRSARMAAVGELAAGVAHELNNPLTTIAGFVELVLEEIKPGSQEYEDLNLVLHETRRASGVVRQLLDFSHQTERSLVQIDINKLSKEVLSLVQHLIKTSGVQIKLEFCDDLPLIQADPNQLKQVLLNLFQNALQAMPLGGQLVIRTDQHFKMGQRGVVIMIQDTGEGIPPENLDRIFEPFFTTRPVGVGTGLGLPVSIGIVTNHGGTIDVASQVGLGSCFTIWLPQNKEELNA